MAAFVLDDLDVAILKLVRLVRPQAGVGHEQNVVVKLFRFPLVTIVFRVLRPFAGGGVELLVLLRRKPAAVRDFS